MITYVRTASIAPGKTTEALAFAHNIAKLVDKLTGVKVGVSMPVGGNPFRIAWVSAEPKSRGCRGHLGQALEQRGLHESLGGRRSLFPARLGARPDVAKRLNRTCAARPTSKDARRALGVTAVTPWRCGLRQNHARAGHRAEGRRVMMMHIRTASIAPGKVPDALAFARQAIALIRERTGVEVRLLTPLGGDQRRLALFAQFDGARARMRRKWPASRTIPSGRRCFPPTREHSCPAPRATEYGALSSGTPTRGKRPGYAAAGYSKNPLPDLRPR